MSGGLRFARDFLATFALCWLLAVLADSFIHLAWSNPLTWEPSSRGIVLLEATLFSAAVSGLRRIAPWD